MLLEIVSSMWQSPCINLLFVDALKGDPITERLNLYDKLRFLEGKHDHWCMTDQIFAMF
jgi:hypothetical protein